MGNNDRQVKQKKAPSNGSKGKEFRFINHSLSAAQSDDLAAMELEAEFPQSLIMDLATEGYKISLSRDDRNNCFVASITDKQEHSPFHNCCLTGRASTALDSWYALAYRHYVLAQGDWSYFGDGDSQPKSRFF